jgi:putative transposase
MPHPFVPRTIRVDQGGQFTPKEFDLRAYATRVTLDFSQPGKSTDNAYVESFNATFGSSVWAGIGFRVGLR